MNAFKWEAVKLPIKPKHAIIKFNNGNGALLCNKCGKIIATGFDHEDRKHYCEEHEQ